MSRARRSLAVALCATTIVCVGAGIATASFSAGTQSSPNRVTAYVLPAPANFRCTGLLNLLGSKLAWDPVVVPGQTTSYQVTDPNNAVTTTTATEYQLKSTLPLLFGTYRLRTYVPAWGWTSTEVTRSVTLNGLGLLYVCL